jgi:hypothetical protein
MDAERSREMLRKSLIMIQTHWKDVEAKYRGSQQAMSVLLRERAFYEAKMIAALKRLNRQSTYLYRGGYHCNDDTSAYTLDGYPNSIMFCNKYFGVTHHGKYFPKSDWQRARDFTREMGRLVGIGSDMDRLRRHDTNNADTWNDIIEELSRTYDTMKERQGAR